MRKPSIFVEAPNIPATQPTTHFVTRSKRAQSTSDVPTRASKRAKTQYVAKHTFTDQQTCSECKKKDTANSLINCTGKCSNKIHRSCLPPLFGIRKKEQVFECNTCQSCSICKKGFLDGARLLKCYLCFTCYHSHCYRPTSGENIRMLKEKRFCCPSCCQNSQKTTPTKQNPIPDRPLRNIDGVLYTVSEASDVETEDFLGFSPSDVPRLPNRRSRSVEPLTTPFNRSKTHLANKDRNSINRPNLANKDRNSINRPNLANKDRNSIDGMNLANKNRNTVDDENNIPDASKWTTNEVYEYFKEMFPRHAHVFEDEEIDGNTIYQLEREDVVERFNLKLGPSLKIYNHIQKMQRKLSNRS